LIAWGLTIWSGLYLVSVLLFSQTAAVESAWWQTLSQTSDVLLLRHGCFFAVGIWLWLASQGLLERIGTVGLAAAIVLGCLEIALRASDMTLEVPGWVSQSEFVPMAVWLIAVSLIFLITSFPAAFTPRSHGVRAGLKRLGAMTYPLFLLHNVAGAGLIRLLISYGVAAEVALVTAIAAAFALSYIVCRYWEPRVRRILLRALTSFEGVLFSQVPRLGFLLAPGGTIVGQETK
jgi:peptidoglycan/LPS O-acetylase OafA/YrhL